MFVLNVAIHLTLHNLYIIPVSFIFICNYSENIRYTQKFRLDFV